MTKSAKYAFLIIIERQNLKTSCRYSIIIILFFIFVALYLFSYHKKVINALYNLAWKLPAIRLPHQDRAIRLSVFTK